MRLFYGVLVLPVICFFTQCGSSEQAKESKHEPKPEQEPAIVEDTSGFAQKLIDTLRIINGDKDQYGLSGELYYEKGDFKIFNFRQEWLVTEYANEFTVVLNPAESGTTDEDVQHLADVVRGLLGSDANNTFAVYYGRFDSTTDVLNNGTRDFVLKWEEQSPEQYAGEARLVLFDGKNRLSFTDMVARSKYNRAMGETREKGVKEELILKQKDPFKVTVRRMEMIDQDEETVTIQYEKVWISENPDYEYSWEVTVVPTGLNSDVEFKKMPKKYDELAEEENAFLTVEDCQNGGLMGFEINNMEVKKAGNQIRANYRMDDSGMYLAVGLQRVDERTVKLLRIRWEMMGAKEDYPIGYTGLDEKAMSVVVFEHSPKGDDMYRIHVENDNKPMYFTTQPQKYQTRKCGN